jgi:hypothetical protein
MKHYEQVDLQKIAIKGLVPESAAAAPGSPVDGQLYYNTTDKKTYQYNSSSTLWVALGSGSGGSGEWKDSVKVATTGPLGGGMGAPGGSQTIDGYTTGTGDRVLVKDQINTAYNGIYSTNTGGTWGRASDANSSSNITTDARVIVEQGAVNQGTTWTMASVGTVTPDTTAQLWVRFDGPGEGTNLITNGDFEAGNPPSSWGTFWGGGTRTNTADTSSKLFGTQCWSTQLAVSSSQVLESTKITAIGGGDEVEVSFWARILTSTGTPTFSVCLYQGPYPGAPGFFDSTSTQVETEALPIGATWKFFRRTFTVIQGTQGAEVFFRMGTDASSTVTYLIDNVTVRKTGTSNTQLDNPKVLFWDKQPVDVATSVDVTTAGGAPQVVDGITLVKGHRVLVRAQINPVQNGIWLVNDPGTGSNGTWVRSMDADGILKLAGAMVSVFSGTAYGGSTWKCSNKIQDTLGTTPIVWNPVLTGATVTAPDWRHSQLGSDFVLVAANNLIPFPVGTGAGSLGYDGAGRFVVGRAGSYKVVANVTIYKTAASGGWLIGSVIHRRGGSVVTQRDSVVTGAAVGTFTHTTITLIVDAQVGDTFEVQCSPEVANQSNAQGGRCQFSANIIGNPIIGASEVRGGVAVGSMNSSTGWVLHTGAVTALATDPLVGGMTLAANGMTVPVGGYYSITTSCSFQTGTGGQLGRKGVTFGVNGTVSPQYQPAEYAYNGAGAKTTNFTALLNAGDTINLFRYTDNTALFPASTGSISAVLLSPQSIIGQADTGWITPTLLNSWTNYGSGWNTAGYRKIAGIVYLKGLVTGGTQGTVVYNLPAGFRPIGGMHFANVTSTAGAGSGNVNANGDILARGTTGYWSMDNVSFPADN